MATTLEQQARDLLERIGIENAQAFSSGDLVELANLISKANGSIQIQKRTPEQAVFALTVKALGLQHDLCAERDRCDTWRKLANGYEDIRSWLRLCEDNQTGHSEFYRQACLIVFGTYREDEFADAPDNQL